MNEKKSYLKENPAHMNVSVIIPTKQRPKSLLRCVKSILRQSRLPNEIVVVDSTDGNQKDLEKKLISECNKIPLIYLKTRSGANYQRNIGGSHANGEILIFLDDDVVLDINYIKVIMENFERDPLIGGVTGKINNFKDKTILGTSSIIRKMIWLSKFGDGKFTSYGYLRSLVKEDRICAIEFMSGCNTVIKKNIWSEILFDEKLEGYSLCDDEDFSYRASRKCRVVFTPYAKLDHCQVPGIRPNVKELNKRLVINRYYLFKKNFNRNFIARIGFFGLIIMIFLHRLINRNWRGLYGLAQGFWEAIIKRRGLISRVNQNEKNIG